MSYRDEDSRGNLRMLANFRSYSVTYTSDATIVHNWITEMISWDPYDQSIVPPFPGVSVQWNHGSHRASTLQLAYGPRVLLFHLASATHFPSSLAWLLCHPGIDFFTFLPPHVVRNFLSAAGIPMTSPTVYNWREMQPPERRFMGIRRLIAVTLGFENPYYCLENRQEFNWFNPVITEQQLTLATLIPFAASEMVFCDF